MPFETEMVSGGMTGVEKVLSFLVLILFASLLSIAFFYGQYLNDLDKKVTDLKHTVSVQGEIIQADAEATISLCENAGVCLP